VEKDFKNFYFYWKSFNELTSKEIYEILHLRQKVFVEEQNCAYVDSDFRDQKSLHLLVYDQNKLIGYLRLIKMDKYQDCPSIGRIVLARAYRSNGIGKQLIEEGIKKSQQLFSNIEIKISAQLGLKEYYEDLGFSIKGEKYLEDGIEHIQMILSPNLKYSFYENCLNLIRSKLFILTIGLLVSISFVLSTFIKEVQTESFNWVAKIDDKYISRSKFERYLNSITNSRRFDNAKDDSELVLEKMIDEELLIQRAIDIGMLDNNSQIRSIIIQNMIKSIMSELETFELSEQDLKIFFNENKEFFSTAPKIRLKKLSFERNEDALNARKLILEGNFIDAQKLARNEIIELPNTILPTIKVREYIGPKLTEIALSMKDGEISDVITELDAFHLIVMIKKIDMSIPDYENVKQQVENEFLKRQGDRLFLDYLENLRSWYDVTKNL